MDNILLNKQATFHPIKPDNKKDKLGDYSHPAAWLQTCVLISWSVLSLWSELLNQTGKINKDYFILSQKLQQSHSDLPYQYRVLPVTLTFVFFPEVGEVDVHTVQTPA